MQPPDFGYVKLNTNALVNHKGEGTVVANYKDEARLWIVGLAGKLGRIPIMEVEL